jgi:hypothetical protein
MSLLGTRGVCVGCEKPRFVYPLLVGGVLVVLCARCGSRKRDR